MKGVELSFLEAGSCSHPAAMVLPGAGLAPLKFPSTVAVITHPEEGVVLFDTGYSRRLFEETRKFPARAYTLLLPVTLPEGGTAVEQLRRKGVAAEDVRHVILSHFHADHVAAVSDFPSARFVYARDAYEAVRSRGGIGRVRAAFFPGLLPPDFEARSRPLEADDFSGNGSYGPFTEVCDIFGDATCLGVKLPGHMPGQMGLVVKEGNGRETFLVADAAWTARSFKEFIPPSRMAGLVMHDWKEYLATLGKLHVMHKERPELRIVPCHCVRTFLELSCDGGTP